MCADGGPRDKALVDPNEAWAWPRTLQPNPELVFHDLELRARREADTLANSGWNDHAACLVYCRFHTIRMPSNAHQRSTILRDVKAATT